MTLSLVNEVEKHPERLFDLLAEMFVYSARSGKIRIPEESLRKQTKATLTFFSAGYTNAIKAIWIDCVERLIGDFSGLMTGILLFRSSTLELDKTLCSATIQKIVEQRFKFLAMEIAGFLSKYLADLDDLAALGRLRSRENAHLHMREIALPENS